MTRHDAARVLYLVRDQLPASKADMAKVKVYRPSTGVAVLLTGLGGLLGLIIGFLGGLGVGVLMNHRIEDAFARNFGGEVEH